MSNEQENKQNELTDAQRKQVEINILLGLANVLDQETVIRSICEILDIDYDEIADKLPENEAAITERTEQLLNNIFPDAEGGEGVDE